MEYCHNALRKDRVGLLIREESERIGVIKVLLLRGTIADKPKSFGSHFPYVHADVRF